MLLLAVIMLAIIAGINRYMTKSFLYPPAIFSALWAVYLFALLLSGDMFYSVSGETLLVYLLGALAFSVGGFVASIRPKQQNTDYISLMESRRAFIYKLIDIGLVVLIISLPIYWNHVKELSAAAGFDNFWQGVRLQSIDNNGLNEKVQIILLNNLVPFSVLIALAAILEKNRTPSRMIRTYIAVILALVYNLMTAGRAGAISLIISWFGLEWLRSRRINFKLVIVLVVVFVVVFSSVAIVLNKGYTRSELSLEDNIPSIIEGFQWYWLGGIVAFDRIVHDPKSISATWSINRFFLETANKFGADYKIPSLHAEYTDISPTMDTNVYTIYFSYFPDYGWLGVLIIMFFLGNILTWLNRKAISGNPQAVILYSMLFSGLVLSCFNEQFFTGLNFYIKAIIFSFILYKLPLISRKNIDRGINSNA